MITHSLATENDHLVGELVYEPNKLWKRQDVTIGFMNGNEQEQLYFRRTYFKWFAATHIRFREVPYAHGADIRVGFALEGDSSWSIIGSDSTIFSHNITSGKSFIDHTRTGGVSLVVAHNTQRQILHEGGHSLSLNHEHFHPYANISWKADFMNGLMLPHYPIKKIRNNYLRKLPSNHSLGKFDR